MSSWRRLFWFGDLGQQLDIMDVESDVDMLRRTAQRHGRNEAEQKAAIADLEREVDDLKVVVAELGRMLVASGTLTADQLERLAKGVDASAARTR
jgi:hypothetical protein